MSHKIFRWSVSFILAVTMISITFVPRPAHAAGPWYVTPTGDDNNDCFTPGTPCATINGALSKASTGDTINVAEGTYPGTGSEVMLIDKNISLSGGWDAEFTIQSGMSTIDGEGARRGMVVSAGVSATIERMLIENGNSGEGGGLYNAGTLKLNNLIIDGNRAGTGGGGIYNSAVLTINNSTISRNLADGGWGGGIYNEGYSSTLTLNNSTISSNTAGYGGNAGGGIYSNSGTVLLNSSTISGNSATAGSVGGIANGGMVTLRNSLLAGNTASTFAPDCVGPLDSAGYNLIGNTASCGFNSSIGDLTDVDPYLGPLTGPSGVPPFHPLVLGSPAIDAGNPAGCTDQDGNLLTTDQRGVARVNACDIGAYEYTVAAPGPASTLSILSGNGQLGALNLPFSKLLQVVVLDNQGSGVSGVTVNFTAPASGASGTFAATGTNTTSVNTNSGGVAAASIFTANGLGGVYTVSASAPGLGSVSFNLEQIDRPANDFFADAKVIPALPFSHSVDNTHASLELGEPQDCLSSPQTVWYSFTPTSNMTVLADMAGSSFSDTIIRVYESNGSGFNHLVLLQCAYFGGSITFSAQAGTTYYIQASSINSGGGDLHVNLQAIPPPANDNFADATVIAALPFGDTVNVTTATTEPGEPASSCAYLGAKNTVWYSFTPATSGSVSAYFPINHFTSVLSVYTGNSLAGLTQVACHSFGGGDEQLTFRAEAGTTYYFQAGSFDGEIGDGSMQLQVWVTPPPVADFFFSPSEPSVFDAISFNDSSFDVGNAGFQSFTWNFGDGVTATGSFANHQYAKDGDYTVQHSVTTVDGRSASTSQIVQVRTHDVGITKVAAPNAASSRQTKLITVSVRNTRYPETVTVDLYKSAPGGDVWVASLTLQVPISRGNKTTSFTFNYTFTAEDAQVGKVTFRAVATINGANDAFPQDNTGISSPPTKVTR